MPALPLDLAPRLCLDRLGLPVCPSGRRPLGTVNDVVDFSEEEEEVVNQEWVHPVHPYSSRAAAKDLSARWAHWLSSGIAAAVAAAAAAADFAAAAVAELNFLFGGWLGPAASFSDPDDDQEEEVMAE